MFLVCECAHHAESRAALPLPDTALKRSLRGRRTRILVITRDSPLRIHSLSSLVGTLRSRRNDSRLPVSEITFQHPSQPQKEGGSQSPDARPPGSNPTRTWHFPEIQSGRKSVHGHRAQKVSQAKSFSVHFQRNKGTSDTPRRLEMTPEFGKTLRIFESRGHRPTVRILGCDVITCQNNTDSAPLPRMLLNILKF